MTASLLFFQASHQSRTTGTDDGMLGSSVQNRSAASKTYAGSSCGNPDSFLSTFEQIAKGHKSNQPNQDVGRGKISPSSANSSGEKFDDLTHTTGDLDTGIFQTTKKHEENLDNPEIPIHPALNLTEIADLIEKLGFNDLIGGSGTSVKVDGIPDDPKGPADLKMLFDRLERNGLFPSTELNALMKKFTEIAQNYQPNQPIQDAGQGKTSPSSASNPGEKSDNIIHTTTGDLDTGIFQTTKKQEENRDNVERPIQPALNLTEIADLIEKLGFNGLIGGSGTSVKVDGISDNPKGPADLKMLFDRLERNGLAPTTELNTELDRLYRLLVNNQTDKAAPSMDMSVLDGLNDSRPKEAADLNQLIKKIVSGQEERTDRPTGQPAASDSGEKSFGHFATKWPNDSETTRPATQLEFRETAETIKSAAESRFVGIEADETTKELRSIEGVRTEKEGLKDGQVVFDKEGAPIRAKYFHRIPWSNASVSQSGGESLQQNMPNAESSSVPKVAYEAQATRASNPLQHHSGESVQPDAANTEASLVSKMIHDAHVAKENLIRTDEVVSDELSGKATKVDAASNDSGLPGSHNQLAEKAFDLASLSRQTDTGQDGLKTQALDQIVRKAVIYMRNGQHEAKIDLKPEFLGHVRMQVLTENHQVTVKILTESGYVKEMVENSIHQLKADLQQQGLNVDKLEVVVANDADEQKHAHDKSGQAKNRQRGGAHANPATQEGEILEREHTGDPDPENSGFATVDYFA